MKFNLNWICTAFLSLLLYATAVWSTDQFLKSQFHPEQFAIASALSHAVNEAPIGSVYAGFVRLFVYQPTNIQETVARLRDGMPPQGDDGLIWPTLPDGNGIVMVAIISVLVEVFGATLAVFPIFAVGLSAISVACIVARFPDARLVVVPLHFLLLSAALLSPIGAEKRLIDEVAIGGFRYVSLLAILPGIHIALEMFDRQSGRAPPLGQVATVVQLAIFMLCQSVRAGVVYLLFATATMVGLALWAKASGLNRRRVAIKALSMACVLGLSASAIYAVAPTDYQREGRVTGVFWHRIVVGLGVNPQWPFGDLKAKYDLCVRPYGQPMQSGVSDHNGMCIWIQYVRSNGLPESELVQGPFGAAHERLARAAFFQIVRDYPDEVMKTFYRYKLEWASAGLNRAVQLHVDPQEANFRVQLMCVVGLFTIFLWSAWRQTAVRFWQMTVASVLFLAWSIVPVLFAWGGAHTMVDSAYWSWATVLCAALASIETVGRLLRSSPFRQPD